MQNAVVTRSGGANDARPVTGNIGDGGLPGPRETGESARSDSVGLAPTARAFPFLQAGIGAGSHGQGLAVDAAEHMMMDWLEQSRGGPSSGADFSETTRHAMTYRSSGGGLPQQGTSAGLSQQGRLPAQTRDQQPASQQEQRGQTSAYQAGGQGSAAGGSISAEAAAPRLRALPLPPPRRPDVSATYGDVVGAQARTRQWSGAGVGVLPDPSRQMVLEFANRNLPDARVRTGGLQGSDRPDGVGHDRTETPGADGGSVGAVGRQAPVPPRGAPLNRSAMAGAGALTPPALF